jgi:hypothetical protein
MKNMKRTKVLMIATIFAGVAMLISVVSMIINFNSFAVITFVGITAIFCSNVVMLISEKKKEKEQG